MAAAATNSTTSTARAPCIFYANEKSPKGEVIGRIKFIDQTTEALSSIVESNPNDSTSGVLGWAMAMGSSGGLILLEHPETKRLVSPVFFKHLVGGTIQFSDTQFPFQKQVNIIYPERDEDPQTEFPTFGYMRKNAIVSASFTTARKVHQFVFDTRFKMRLQTLSVSVFQGMLKPKTLFCYVGRVLTSRKPHHASTEAIVASMPVDDSALSHETRQLINQVVNRQIPMPEERRDELTALPAYQQKLSRIHYFVDPCVEGSQGVPLYDCTKDQVGGVEFLAANPFLNNGITIKGTIVADLFRENEIEEGLPFVSGAPGFARHVVLRDGVKPDSYIIELFEEGRPGAAELRKTINYIETRNRQDSVSLEGLKGRVGYKPRYAGPEAGFDPNKDYPEINF